MTAEECYKLAGGDYQAVIERVGTEERVVKYLGKFLKDGSYQALCEALERRDWKQAFTCAHNLKGMCVNLSLTGIGQAASELCEALRYGPPEEDLTAPIEELKRSYEQTASSVSEFFNHS